MDFNAKVPALFLPKSHSTFGDSRRLSRHRLPNMKHKPPKCADDKAQNFRYVNMAFGDFAEQVKNGKRLYLRSLSADGPTDRPASLEQDFRSLTDFALPVEFSECAENIHSSVLRVSGPVNMWLHFGKDCSMRGCPRAILSAVNTHRSSTVVPQPCPHPWLTRSPDVQANIYCQIHGSKRMLLFPPSDVTRLAFAPGASSSSLDVFGCLHSPALAGTHPLEAEVRPGDVLYLPPLVSLVSKYAQAKECFANRRGKWPHTATPTSGISIAVNVFFRSLGPGAYATGRDVYGNKDLAAYEKGRQDVSRIVSAFSKVPTSCKQFYLLRLADELAEKAMNLDD